MSKIQYDPQIDYNTISKFLHIHPFVTQAFLEKSPLSTQRFFYFLYGNFYTTTSPFVFKEMRKAVELIQKGCKEKKSFYIVGDKDADGVTSISIIKIFLEKLGVEVYYNLPLNKESYGFSDRIFNDIVTKKDELCCVITVDCGIKENHFINKLNDLNIKTIITDHHKLDSEELPKSYAIINPHLYEEEFLPLCGGALAFKLVQAIYLSYTSFYEKKTVFILPLQNKIGYNIGVSKDVYSPLIYSTFTESVDEDDELINILGDDNYIIYTTKSIIEDLEGTILQDQSEQTYLIEQMYDSYTKTKETVTLKEIIKKEQMYPFSNQSVFPFSLLVRKIIYKYHLQLQDKLSFFIEYATVALICDRMDLNHPETHSMIRTGLLSLLDDTKFSPLKLLFNNENLYFDIEKTVAIQIGPLLNAPGRLGKANIVVDFLVASNKEKALIHLDKLKKLNQERQKLQQNCFQEVMNHIELYEKEKDFDIFLYASDTIEQGITGILANNISKALQKPTIIISLNKEKQIGIGSGRTQSRALHPILEPMKDTFTAFGGHNKACGFTLPLDKLEDFKNHISNFNIHSIVDNKENECCIIELDHFGLVNSSFIDSLEKLEPFGEAHPKPLFRSTITLDNINIFGKEQNHLKIRSFENSNIDIIFWKKAEIYKELVDQPKIVITYNLNYNIYRNGINAIIHDYESIDLIINQNINKS